MEFSKDEKEALEEFEFLFKLHHNDFCNKVYLLVRDKDASADIVQSVFYKFWINRSKIKIHTSPVNYLFKACVYEAHNYIKSKKRRAILLTRFFQDKSISSRTVDEYIEFTETSMQIQKAIDELPPVCKLVFLLSRTEDKTHQQIAEQLNISENTVNNHIKKALKLLKKYLPVILPFLTEVKLFESIR